MYQSLFNELPTTTIDPSYIYGFLGGYIILNNDNKLDLPKPRKGVYKCGDINGIIDCNTIDTSFINNLYEDIYHKNEVYNKIESDNKYYSKLYVDENIYTKNMIDSGFYNKSFIDSNFYTNTYINTNFYNKTAVNALIANIYNVPLSNFLTPNQNINMGNYKFTNAGDATSDQEFATLKQLNNASFSSGASTQARYIIHGSIDGTLPNSFALSSLSNGVLKNVNGELQTAIIGTDYFKPSVGPLNMGGYNITNLVMAGGNPLEAVNKQYVDNLINLPYYDLDLYNDQWQIIYSENMASISKALIHFHSEIILMNMNAEYEDANFSFLLVIHSEDSDIKTRGIKEKNIDKSAGMANCDFVYSVLNNLFTISVKGLANTHIKARLQINRIAIIFN